MKDRLNALTAEIIGAAVDVHRALGPGPLPVVYRGGVIDCAYRMDFVVNDDLIVETKAVEKLTHVHEAQLLSYLRLYDRQVGLLLNFNVKWLVDHGLKRLVNNFPE